MNIDHLAELIKKFEGFFCMNHSFVPVYAIEFPNKWDGLTYEEYKIINLNSKLFYKCSARRIVLIKWIIEDTEKIFEGKKTVKVEEVYEHLSKQFDVSSFNRGKLHELFETKDYLTYDRFSAIRDKYLNEYKKVMKTDPLEENSTESVKLSIETNEKVLHILGEEMFSWCLENHEGVIDLISILQSYSKEYLRVQKVRAELNQLFSAIDVSNHDAKIPPLVLAFKSNEENQGLLQLLEEHRVSYVKQLKNLCSIDTYPTEVTDLTDFMKWLSKDIKNLILKELPTIFKKDREKEVLIKRIEGYTLEEIGNEFNITRERVRQIELKVLRQFERYLSKFSPHYICYAFSENFGFLSADDIKKLMGDLSNIIVYCLRQSDVPEIKWLEKLDGFAVGDGAWYNQISKYIELLPDVFEASELGSYVQKALESLSTDVNYNLIEKVILSDCTLTGNIFSTKKINKANAYLKILEKYYPYGIKLFDDFEMMRFRDYSKILFGDDIDLPDNDRAICARIAALTVLCDRGKYILPSRIRYDQKTFDQIYDFIIGSERNVIMFAELFERFKTELLEKTSVNNRFYLQGVIKYKYPNDFLYTKDTLIKDTNSEEDIKTLIEDFIKEKKQIVTKEEIKAQFPGLTEAVLFSAISNNPNILMWDYRKYLHSEHLVLDSLTRGRFKKLLDQYTAQGSASVQKIYSDIYTYETEFLSTNNVYDPTALFSVFNYLFPEDYEFNRPYIAPRGSMATTFNTVLREYLSGFDELSITDFKEYVESIRRGAISIGALLDEISDEFIRIDSDVLLRTDRLNLPEDTIKNIEEITLVLVGSQGYLAVKKDSDFMFYPDIDIKWNQFLLVSIVKYYCKRLKIINTATDYRYLNEVIVDVSSEVNDYEELLYHALKQETKYNLFKNIEEMRKFLLNQDLIVNSIPQSFFDKGYTVEDMLAGDE